MRRILSSLLFLGILAGIIYYVVEQGNFFPGFPPQSRTTIANPSAVLTDSNTDTPAVADAAPTAAPSPTGADQPLPEVDLYSLTTQEFLALPQLQAHIGKSNFNLTLLEAAVFHETNRQRTLNNLPIFKYSSAMNLMARQHSQEMSDLQYFEHDSPVPANHSLGDRLRNVGLVNVTAGENIAVLPAREMGSGRYVTHPGQGNDVWFDEVTGKRVEYYTYAALATEVLTQWMNSPHHHENIVHKEFRYLGIGIARGPYESAKQDSFYFTQNFTATIKPDSESQSKGKLSP